MVVDLSNPFTDGSIVIPDGFRPGVSPSSSLPLTNPSQAMAGMGPVLNYVFPSTLLGQQVSATTASTVRVLYPFILFTLIKFRDRWNIKDKNDASSHMEVAAADQTITIATIALPIPPDIQSAVSPQWDMMDSKILSAGMDIFKHGLFSNDTYNNVMGILTPTIQQKIYQNTANPKKQAFFQGIDPRDFSFVWTLTPQTAAEALAVRNIVQCFTMNSLPDVQNSEQAYFQFPCEYMIQFAGVTGFPKFPESLVCTGVGVNYTQNGLELTTHGDAVSTQLTLTFKETTIRTRGNPGI